MELVVRPHVMSDRETAKYIIEPGKTIAEIVAGISEIDPTVKLRNLAVLVNGDIEDNWNRIPQIGDSMTIAARLYGGDDGDGKSILGAIAMIVISIFAPYAGAALYGAGTVGASIVSAGIMIVGSLVVNAIFAPPAAAQTSPEKLADGSRSNTYQFGGQSNGYRPFGVIPRVYGKHRMMPDLAAVPYTVNVGDDQYFHAIYNFGYAPIVLSDFRIGQNLLTNYTDYDIVVHESFTDASQLQLYKSDVWQEGFNIDVTDDTYATVATRVDTDHATVDFVFPQGLVEFTEHFGAWPYTQKMSVEFRDTLNVGGPWNTQWNPVQAFSGKVPFASRGTVGGVAGVFISVAENVYTGEPDKWGQADWLNNFGIPKGTNDFTIQSWENGQPVPGQYITIGAYTLQIATVGPTNFTTTTGLPDTVRTYFFRNQALPILARFTTGDWNGEWELSDDRAGAFPASIDIPFPYPSTWEIRVKNISVDPAEDDQKHLWKHNLVGLKSYKNIPPLAPEVPMTIVEFRIKATAQINGTIDDFNAMASSKLRRWNGSAWVVEETSNPAWVYLDVLTGTANSRAVADSRVDIEKLKSWAARSELIVSPFTTKNAECNFIVDKNYTMWELLQSIAANGRAAPTMRDNKYSVILDDETRTPVQMFTPRNSSNLQSNRTYIEGPHALRVKWVDPVANYQLAQVVVYRTGYSEMNATVFEDLDTFGITNQEAAIRFGRYMLAQGLLRQERFSLETDIENIICLRGDLVYVAHDTIQVGGDAVRIEAINGRVLTLDAPMSLLFADFEDPNDETYGVRIRRKDGFMTAVLAVRSLEGTTLTLAPSVSMTGIDVGDLLVFGEKETIVGQYTVDKIVPAADLAATIFLEEYAPLVYEAEYTGIIPDYEPQKGSAYRGWPVDQLTATLIEYVDDEVYPRGRIRLNWVPPQTQGVIPVAYHVYNIRRDGSELFLGRTTDWAFTTDPIDMWILGGTTLTYAVRAEYDKAGLSQPAFVDYNLPSRATVAPPNYDFFEVVDQPSGFRRYNFAYVNIPQPPRIIGAEIRYYPGHGAPPTWANMTNIAGDNPTLPYATSGLELAAPPAGEWTFGIRAMDVLRVLSDDIGYVTITLGASANEGGDPGFDPTPPPTPTGIVLTGFFTRILVEQDDPDYAMGRGHASTQVYGLEWQVGDPEPVFGQATLIQAFVGNVGQVSADIGKTYRIWVTWKTRDGVESVIPAGGANGFEVSTGADVESLLDVLTGELTSAQLHADLAARIDLIDADADVPGSVNARVDALAQTVLQGDTALAQSINTVQARLATRPNLLSNGGFQILDAAGNATGWTYTLGTWTARNDTWGRWVGTSVNANGTAVSPKFPVTAGTVYTLSGDHYLAASTQTPRVQFRIEYLSAAGAVLSTVNGVNKAPHAFSNDPAQRQEFSFESTAPANAVEARVVLAWTTPGTLITVGMRYIKVEAGTMPSTGYTDETTGNAIAASVQQEATARATVDGQLQAQWTVKTDLNGYVSGFGLASTLNSATPSSAFAVRADSFYIASPSGPGVPPSLPFIVRTTPVTINGEVVPIGVYMSDAYIQNGTITNAKIANASIQDAKILNLSAAKINTGFLSADRIAAGSITADKLTIGNGKNIVVNSSWVERTGAIANWWGLGGNLPQPPSLIGINDPSWTPFGTVVPFMYMNGEYGALNQYFADYGGGACPVTPGKRYEFQGKTGVHRCLGRVVIAFYDGGGNYITEASSGGGGLTSNPTGDNDEELPGGVYLGAFKVTGGFAIAPNGATRATLIFRKFATKPGLGYTSSYMFFTQPMIAEATSSQSVLSPYEPTGLITLITPAGITTPSIAAISANLGAILTATMEVHNDGAGGWGYIRTPGKWLNDGSWGWMFARHGAGSHFWDFTAGPVHMHMYYNAANGATDNYMGWPGFFVHNGGMTITQLNVIDTLNIAGNAVTVPAYTESAGVGIVSLPVGIAWEGGLVAVGINSGFSPVLIMFDGQVEFTGAFPENIDYQVRLYRNGVLVASKAFAAPTAVGSMTACKFWIGGSGGGDSWQINLWARNNVAQTAELINRNSSMFAIGVKR